MEQSAKFFPWLAWLLFFCLFLIGSAEGSRAVAAFAYSGELLVVGYWVGGWIRGRKGANRKETVKGGDRGED